MLHSCLVVYNGPGYWFVVVCLQAGLLPVEFPDLELKSKEPFALTSFALSLLLVRSKFSCHLGYSYSAAAYRFTMAWWSQVRSCDSMLY